MRLALGWNRRLWGFIGAGLLVLLPTAATAGSASLAWDPNTEADLAGYKVHVGSSSRTYTRTINAGNVTTVTVPDLADGGTYYFAVTAYDIFANESGFSSEVSTTVAMSNSPPSASFTSTCADLSCTFTNTSTDADGTVVASNWTFGDGMSSTAQSPRHTYASAGTYAVSLTVTDNAGLTHSTSKNIAVSTISPTGITLSAVGYRVKGLQKADLTWSGPASANVDIYRNGFKTTTIANAGSFTDDINKRGQATYTYQVCEAGSATCSNIATVITK